jgi:hypothetical protein
MVEQNKPVTRATAMGYLDQTRQGQQSTKSKRGPRSKHPVRFSAPISSPPSPIDDALHSHIQDEFESPNLCFQVLSVKDFMNSSDATGKFPFPTVSGYNYILVSTLKGYVHFELMRSRHASEYVRVYTAMYAFYAELGKLPTTRQRDVQ